jgi:kinetochore-associated protein 1
VDHFVVLDSPVQSDGELTAKLTVLTHPNAGGNREIRVCSVPGMQCLYSVELSSFAYLASPVKNADSLFFVEGMADGHGTSAGFSCVRLASLSETNAETRLSRLLQKERFSDAETAGKNVWSRCSACISSTNFTTSGFIESLENCHNG